MFGASSELASVMEFGFIVKSNRRNGACLPCVCRRVWRCTSMAVVTLWWTTFARGSYSASVSPRPSVSSCRPSSSSFCATCRRPSRWPSRRATRRPTRSPTSCLSACRPTTWPTTATGHFVQDISQTSSSLYRLLPLYTWYHRCKKRFYVFYSCHVFTFF